MHNGVKGFFSEKQALVYEMFFNQRIKQKDIATRLKISKQAVSKLIKKCLQKSKKNNEKLRGLTNGDTVANRGLTFSSSIGNKGIWRFHALHFIIKPFYFMPRYKQIRQERGNYGIRHGQFTIMLYKDRVRIQSEHGQGWHNEDKYKAIQAAEHDFNDFLAYASKTYGFEYYKEGRVSIKLVSSELALENSTLSKDYKETTGENTLIIKDRDGKVYFLIDQSTGTPEHEYIGRNTFSNSERLEHYLNDFLYNQPLTNSQIASRINDLTTLSENILKILKEKI